MDNTFNFDAWKQQGEAALEAKREQFDIAMADVEAAQMRVTLATEQLAEAKDAMARAKAIVEQCKQEMSGIEMALFGAPSKQPGKPRPKLRQHILEAAVDPIDMDALTRQVAEQAGSLATPQSIRLAVIRADKEGLVDFDRDLNVVCACSGESMDSDGE